MKRGIVMSVHAKHAVVMTAEGQFIRAPLQGSPQIGEEIVFEEEQSEPRRIKWNRISMRYTAIAAMLGIMLIAIAGLAYAFSATHPVVAYLTMDINPSVEIGVDGGEKVRKLRALNEDGEQIIAGIAYKGVDVETVAAAILEQASNAHYLDAPHKDILITSVLLNGKKQPGLEFESLLTSKLDEKLQKWLSEHIASNQEVTITTLSVPESLRVEADANGISSGKMAVYLMAKYEGYQVELSKLKEESIDSWSEPIGGMKSIVATEDEAATKKKLEKLLAKEKKAQQAKGGSSGAGKTTKPASTATPKPSAKPSSKPTAKPSVKPSESSKPNRYGWWHDRDEDDRDDDDDDDRLTSGKWNNGKNHDKWKNHNWNNQWNNSKHNGWYNTKDNKNTKDKKSDKDNKNSSITGKNGKTGTDESKNGNKNKGESDKNSTKNNGKNSSKTDQKGNKQNERDKDSSKKGSRNEQDKDDDDDRSGRNRGNSDRDRDKADDRKGSSSDGHQHSSRD